MFLMPANFVNLLILPFWLDSRLVHSRLHQEPRRKIIPRFRHHKDFYASQASSGGWAECLADNTDVPLPSLISEMRFRGFP